MTTTNGVGLASWLNGVLNATRHDMAAVQRKRFQ